jgi:hypothetical protein
VKAPWGQSSKQAYQKQEARISAKPGARAQINSGRTWKSLRDVVEQTPLFHILFDCKGPKVEGEETTFKLEPKKWRELRRDANRTPPGCVPGYQLDLAPDVRLVVIDEATWDDFNAIVRLRTMQKADAVQEGR